MQVTLLSNGDAEKTLITLTRSCTSLSVAVAWATPNPVSREMLNHQAKIKQLIIGTHFYQTDPKLLKDFVGVKSAAVMPPKGALFHPKVYLFVHGETMSAVVGSHNMTKSAMGGDNVEASVLLQGPKDHPALVQLKNFVTGAWNEAETLDDNFLFSYEPQYRANQKSRESLKSFHRLKRPRRGSAYATPLQLSWVAFDAAVREDEPAGIETRLEILETSRSLFETRASFAEMDVFERKAVAGTYDPKEQGLAGFDWGLFGRMSAVGTFKNVVTSSYQQLGRALDEIPLNGPVAEQRYDDFVAHFRSAFDGQSRKGKIAPASRLLAMKRPDIFVAVNSRNRERLCAAFGVAHTTLDLNNYWERIVVPTSLSPWWLHPRPRARLSARIWDNRAALLDCIYYAPAE
ncbi:phospholipase D family protein [Nitrogeniibacter aestuarii]|uniref:phospholipase D family protein n=1 Tax=Nitrogeniibacter aestuarii TaxID=2815343 RepID=UPI001E654D94|nr:phospholipase D family protein [Nitrogeniibacter aestuarii]